MSSLRQYEIHVKTPIGDERFEVNGEILAKWTLRQGKPGVLTLDLPADYCNPFSQTFNVDDFGIDYRIEVWRTINNQANAPKQLVGNSPFFVDLLSSKKDGDGRRTLHLECTNALGLLNRRTHPYRKETADSQFTNAGVGPVLAVDDFMKLIVRRNFLAIAGQYNLDPDPIRDLSAYFQVQADAGLGALYETEAQHSTVISILIKASEFSFSNGPPILYDVVQTANAGAPFLEFITAQDQLGVDRTQTTGAVPLILTDTDERLAEYSLDVDFRKAANRVYMGGKGDPRAFSVADDPNLAADLAINPFLLREIFKSSKTDDAAALTDEGTAELSSRAAAISATGKIIDQNGFIYGQDWNINDRLTVVIDGVMLDVWVDSESVELSGLQEKLGSTFTTNLNSSPTGAGELYSDVARLQREVAYLQTID